MKREVTVEISSEGFLRTGIKSDITQVFLFINYWLLGLVW